MFDGISGLVRQIKLTAILLDVSDCRVGQSKLNSNIYSTHDVS